MLRTTAILSAPTLDAPLDLLSGPYRVAKYSLPTAKALDSYDDKQRNGQRPGVCDYDLAPFSLTIHIVGTGNADVAAARAALTRYLSTPDVCLSWAEDYGLVMTTTIADCAMDASQSEIKTTSAVVTYTGNRYPAWRGLSTPFSVICPLWGTVDLPFTPNGEVESDVTLMHTCAQPTNAQWLGVKADPGTHYDPIDDYDTGITDANAVGGHRATALTLSGTSALAYTAPIVDANDNRGGHFFVARGIASATCMLFGGNAIHPTIGNAYQELNPGIATVNIALSTLNLGAVAFPVQNVPNLASSLGWAPQVKTHSSTSGSSHYTSPGVQTASIPTTAGERVSQVVIPLYIPSLLQSSVAVFAAVRRSSDHVLMCDLAPVYVDSSTTSATFIPTTGSDGILDGTTVYIDLTLPTGAFSVGVSPATAQYEFWTQQPIVFGASTPVYASGSGTYSLDAVARIPLDDFASIVTTPLGANEGVTFSTFDRIVYQANAAGSVGASVSGQVLGLRPGFAPGVVNRFVAAADLQTPALPTTMTIAGVSTDQWIDRARAV